jgi:hypothetical protein
MSTVFWVATLVMAMLAFSFVATPLLKNNRRFELIGIAVALPVFAAVLYWSVGSPQAADISFTASSSTQITNVSATATSTSEPVGSVASMVDGLADRLRQNPDDAKSWLLLARSYHHLNRVEDARAAYARASALGEYDEKLAALSESPTVKSSATAQIFGNLRLSERSRDIVRPTDTVFIFARAVDGPPMPVAVLRRPVSDLPLDFLLNDTQSLSDASKLSDVEKVFVTARISRTGVASDALQDLEARSGAIVVAENRHLDLIIE